MVPERRPHDFTAPGTAARLQHALRQDRRRVPELSSRLPPLWKPGDGEEEEGHAQAMAQTAPVLGGRKDSRSHGISEGKITVSLRQLRRRGRRSLPRPRPRLRPGNPWRLTEARRRMREGRGGDGCGA